MKRPVRRNLRLMALDGGAFSLMVGAGETFLPAFALALGLGDIAAGLVATVPLLGGALLQMVAPHAIERLGSRRRWVVVCALTQALTFVPLVAAALAGRLPASALFAIAAVYWAAGLSAGAAWNSWAEDLVPAALRPRFFARRARLMQLAVLLGLLAGGVMLDAGREGTSRMPAFAALFALAMAARLASASFLLRQSEPKLEPGSLAPLDFATLCHRLARGASGRLLVYLLGAQVAVQLAAPYFTPYMLSELQVSYREYMALLGTAYVVRVLVSPLFGELIRRVGARRVLFWSSLCLAPAPIWWILSDAVHWLLLAQVYAGIVWGAFELSSLLLFFETIHVRERTSVLTLYNLANAGAFVLGSLLGGALLATFGASLAGYHLVFLISGLARIAPVALLRGIPETRPLSGAVTLRTVAVRANSGSLEQPVLSAMPRRRWMQTLRTLQLLHLIRARLRR